MPISILVDKVDLSTCETRAESASRSVVYACGTLEGAAYYAWRHNRSSANNAPILIGFDCHIDQVGIDGKDFLYTAFQMGEPEKARSVLELLFGPKILTYAERAWGSDDQDRRIALCDLATMDPDVVAAHYANRTVIGGRYNTIFENAFTVALPIRPEAIVCAWSPTHRYKERTASVTLADIR